MLWLGLGASVLLGAFRWSLKRHFAEAGIRVGLWLLLSQAIVIWGGPYLPGPAKWLDVRRWKSAVGFESVTKVAEVSRHGFVTTPGDTAIQTGASPLPQTTPPVTPTPAPVASPVPSPVPSVVTPAVPPAAARKESWVQHIVVGFAALFVPRFVGQELGLFRIAGGRGFCAFADLDTLFLVGAAVVTCGLAYVVTNFGTLFRLREMVLVCLAVLPLAATEPARLDVGDDGSSGRPSGGEPCVE